MPRSSGTYSAPASSWSPAVSGNAANFGDWNTLLADISAALTQSLSQDGQTNPTANLPMAGFKHTGVGNASGAGQYIAWGQSCTLGTVTVSGLVGDGSGLTSLSATSLTTGTIPDARFPATLPSGVAVTTVAQFDNDTSPASTAFVQRALGNLAGSATYNTSTSLLVADFGKWIVIPSGTGSISLALPTVAVTAGSQYRVYNATAASNVTLTTTGQIVSGGSGPVGSIVIGPGQTFDVTTDGVNGWVISQGDPKRQAVFAASLVSNGSQTLPSGLIIKFGTTAHAGAAANINQATSYTTSFPTAVLAVNLTDTNGVNITGVSASSTSGFTASVWNRDPGSNVTAATTNWVAIGY